MCKKQNSVSHSSHSSTESEIISLNARLRLDGIPAIDLWDLIVAVLGNTNQNHDRTERPVVCRGKNHVQEQSRGMFNVLNNVDLVPSSVRFSHRYCELATKTTQQLQKVSTPCIDDHHFKEEEMKSVGELFALKISLKCLYLARIGRPDIPWSVNKLA